jgi:hypothetical protein
MAQIQPEIGEYFQRERPHEQPNLIKGDWNGDGKTDYAAMLQSKSNQEKRITIVLMKSGKTYQTHILGASDCIMSIKRGKKDYDFERKKNFQYKNDAIFDYIWEKAGSSYVWEKGRFRGILTSD